MGKQLDFNKKEQRILADCIKQIGEILWKKMDKGVTAPCLSGQLEVENEDKKLVFELTATKKND
jgi:hypothetical protein